MAPRHHHQLIKTARPHEQIVTSAAANTAVRISGATSARDCNLACDGGLFPRDHHRTTNPARDLGSGEISAASYCQLGPAEESLRRPRVALRYRTEMGRAWLHNDKTRWCAMASRHGKPRYRHHNTTLKRIFCVLFALICVLASTASSGLDWPREFS